MKKEDKKKITKFLFSLLVVLAINIPSLTIIRSIANAQTIASNLFCSNGRVFCTSSQQPVCSDPTFSLKCLPGFPNDYPDCCNESDCQPGLLMCVTSTSSTSSTSSSSSSSSSSSGCSIILCPLGCSQNPVTCMCDCPSSSSSGGGAFCSNGMVFCTNGQQAFCSNQSYTLKCLPGFPDDYPDCCNESDCQPGLLMCGASTSSTSSTSSSSSSSSSSSGCSIIL